MTTPQVLGARCGARRAAAALLVAVVAVGCGARPTVSSSSDSAPGGSDGKPAADAAVADASTPPPPGNRECVVAIRFGGCCPTIEAVSADALAADRCLLRWPADRPTKDCPQLCNAICYGPAPPSRVAERAPEGSCRFVDECQSAKDCGIGYNQSSCCDCGNVYPVAFLKSHPCYNGDGSGCGDGCPEGGPLCDCAAPPWPPTCVLATSEQQYNLCAYDSSGGRP